MLQFAKTKIGILSAVSGSSSDASESVSQTTQTLDYSDTLQQIAQLVAYADIALLLISVLALLGIGVFVGHLVTRWMHGN